MKPSGKNSPVATAATAKILIVEDHPQICELIRLTLSPLRASVLETDTAERGIAMAREHRPDVIILDVHLAGGANGFEACREIKANAELAHTRVIIVTTESQTSAVRASESVCADAFLTKPFSPQALRDMVQAFLRQSPLPKLRRIS